MALDQSPGQAAMVDWRGKRRQSASHRSLLRRRFQAAGRLTVLIGLLLGGQVVQSTPAGAVFPGFNGRIVFVSERDGNEELYTINPDGSNLVRLTNHPARESSPQWSPDGSRIAFTSDRDGESGVYVMNANGSGVTRITSGSNPSWSPDGQRLAYNAPAPGELSVRTLATGATVQLTFDSCLKFSGVGEINDPDCPYSVVHNHSPSWSPDGQVIAFRKVQGTSSGVWLINADGLDERVLVNSPHANHIDWAPDGQRLAYSDHSDSIQIVNRDGSGWHVVPNTRQCVPGNCFVLQQPGWSPDGRLLVAATAIPVSIEAPGLYVFTPEGDNLHRILDDDTVDGARPHWQSTRVPALPPDVAAIVCPILEAMQQPAVQAVFVQMAASLGCATA